MMTGLGILLGTSLLMFVGSLLYAVIADWVGSNRAFRQMVADHVRPSHSVQRNFQFAARRPARVLGSFIL